MKVLRGWIICHKVSLRLGAGEFSSRNFGWTRTEPIGKLLQELGLEIIDKGTVQVIPVGDEI